MAPLKAFVYTFTILNTVLSSIPVLLQLPSALLLQMFSQYKQQQSLIRVLTVEHNKALTRQRYLRFRAVRRRRRIWVSPGRTAVWWNDLIGGKMDEKEWKLNLHHDQNGCQKTAWFLACAETILLQFPIDRPGMENKQRLHEHFTPERLFTWRFSSRFIPG